MIALDTTEVTPAPYGKRNLNDIEAITVFDGSMYHVVNQPRSLYETAKGFTIRANDPANTVKVVSDNGGIVAVIFKNGHTASDYSHINLLKH